MHLRRLIVLIINARNIINPSPLLSSGKGLHHRADVLPTHHCIGFDRSDQKKPFFTHSHCSSPRVSGQTDSVVSIHDVQRSGHGRPKASTQPNLLSFLRRISICSAITRPPEKTWWSQTGSNRRHPACKAGALPAELWPHFWAFCIRPQMRTRCKIPKGWWARVDSNYRPHAYQACALTT